MSMYKISMKGEEYLVQANTRQIAFKKMFKDILNGKISLDDVSLIMMSYDGKEEVPMRILPSLYACKLITYESAIATLLNAGIDMNYKEFMATVKADEWLWKEVKQK